MFIRTFGLIFCCSISGLSNLNSKNKTQSQYWRKKIQCEQDFGNCKVLISVIRCINTLQSLKSWMEFKLDKPILYTLKVRSRARARARVCVCVCVCVCTKYLYLSNINPINIKYISTWYFTNAKADVQKRKKTDVSIGERMKTIQANGTGEDRRGPWPCLRHKFTLLIYLVVNKRGRSPIKDRK